MKVHDYNFPAAVFQHFAGFAEVVRRSAEASLATEQVQKGSERGRTGWQRQRRLPSPWPSLKEPGGEHG